MLVTRSRSRSPAIASELRRRIAAGEWKRRAQIQTEHQLAREFGVSRGTVIRSLRELEREGLIWTRRGEGRYVAERALRPRTNVIAVVIGDMSMLDYQIVSDEISGIREACAGSQCHLQIVALNGAATLSTTSAVLDQLDPKQIDGVILANWLLPEQYAQQLASRMPMVWRGKPHPESGITGIVHDFCGGMLDAASHVLRIGHRDILLVTIADQHFQSLQQREGLRLAMRPYETVARTRIIGAIRNRDTGWLGEFRAMMSRDDRPGAILFGSDDLAQNGLSVLNDLHLSIPQDVSITSMNDTLAPPVVPVPLTSIRCDYKEIGRQSVGLLQDLIDDPGPSRRTVVLPTQLIVRESTAAVPSVQRTNTSTQLPGGTSIRRGVVI